jgi:uncharacterized protein (DUF342 family)
MATEAAAAQEPGGPRGPVDVSWLILQRLSDLKEQMADLRRAQDEMRADLKALDAKVESVRRDLGARSDNVDAKVESARRDLDAKIESVRRESLGLWRWSLALLLVPILGLLAKVLIPGA